MYVNGKMRPDEPIPTMRERGMKKSHEGSKFSYDTFDIL
jgi:hypothetical protein